MKKSLTDAQRKYVYFNALKALAWAAIVCTVALAIFIMVESWLPAGESSKQSDAVSNTLLSVSGKTESSADYTSILSAFGINTSAKASYKLFMRKLVGHYLLFAVLGVGLGVSFYLISKHRYLFGVYALAVGVVIAVISEVLQLPVFTTGRVFTLEDIGIDILGVLSGLIFAGACILLVTAIFKHSKKNRYPLYKQALDGLCSKTLASRVGKVTAAYCDEYGR